MNEAAQQFVERRARLGMPLTMPRRVRAIPPPPVLVVLPAAAPVFVPYWKQIATEVAKKHGVSFNDLLSNSRHKVIVQARNEAMYRLRNEITVKGKPLSFPIIAKRFGKDHSTVLHSYRNHVNRSLSVAVDTGAETASRTTQEPPPLVDGFSEADHIEDRHSNSEAVIG